MIFSNKISIDELKKLFVIWGEPYAWPMITVEFLGIFLREGIEHLLLGLDRSLILLFTCIILYKL